MLKSCQYCLLALMTPGRFEESIGSHHISVFETESDARVCARIASGSTFEDRRYELPWNLGGPEGL